MEKVLIIAEAGVNHNGSLKLAKQLIDVAAAAGVDIVKFQSFRVENLVSKQAVQADYQIRNLGSSDQSQFSMLKKLELSQADHQILFEYCREKGVAFLSTAFDFESIDFLATLKPDLWKIPSGEITNYPYLKRIAQFRKPVILSTGMSTLEEITTAMNVLEKFGLSRNQITVLHCNTEYPTPMCDVNLRAIQTIAAELKVSTGYSDHTVGIEIPVAAVALGAKVIEKHFTLDRNLAGPDHKASLEPRELKAMVSAIRNVELALGDGVKRVSDSEKKNKNIARKSIVAACPIKKGEAFNETNLTVKRPGDGISPMFWDEVLGRLAGKDFQADDLIEL
ncbi:N-acetylneuraminate synthase [Gabonibacter chumensis]|uniref:N-acetylneuraminate synthase n=1 Tax=Gabonibacter chumensis TaxID=2972474 RepID=UPI002573D969|nr:N-acetylneuraminate synthase [Gabonibacter chumensis]MCR9013073.1 N-acetylneuraminate synthase [Gabonibacter chumensis]